MGLLVKMKRLTALVYLFPKRYVGELDIDLEEWSEEFEWEEDPHQGYLDYLSPLEQTVESGKGDCEDYAFVALSAMKAEGRSGVDLVWCYEGNYPYPKHVVVYDGEKVYSSGYIFPESLDEYVERNGYDYINRTNIL